MLLSNRFDLFVQCIFVRQHSRESVFLINATDAYIDHLLLSVYQAIISTEENFSSITGLCYCYCAAQFSVVCHK